MFIDLKKGECSSFNTEYFLKTIAPAVRVLADLPHRWLHFSFLTLVANLTNETSERFGSGEVICSSLANEKMLGQHFATATNYKLQSGSNHRNQP